MIRNALDNQFFRFIPILSLPAIKKEGLSKDDHALTIRITLATLPALAAFSAMIVCAVISLASATIIPAFGITLVLTGLALATAMLVDKFEKNRATKALSEKALAEYQTNENPSQQAINLIGIDTDIIKKLIDSKTDLNKVSKENGYSILDWQMIYWPLSDNINKSLINNGAKLKAHHFLLAITNDNFYFLKYILENKFVTPASFSNNEQIIFWTHIKSRKIGKLLMEYNFDINVLNDKGKTTLQVLQENQSNPSLLCPKNFPELFVPKVLTNLDNLIAFIQELSNSNKV
jgi:hypothetical protein